MKFTILWQRVKGKRKTFQLSEFTRWRCTANKRRLQTSPYLYYIILYEYISTFIIPRVASSNNNDYAQLQWEKTPILHCGWCLRIFPLSCCFYTGLLSSLSMSVHATNRPAESDKLDNWMHFFCLKSKYALPIIIIYML